jgi:hypothetical protein
MFRSASQAMTPSAAASPYALPPVKSNAWISVSRLPVCKLISSRDPGEDPRTSHDVTLPRGGKITVQPVRATSSLQ